MERTNMNLQSYITAIESTNDVHTLKALWWTIGMDINTNLEELSYLADKLMERYNKIK